MLPRRRFAKHAPPPAEIVYFSYEESLSSRRAARPKLRYVVAALLASTVAFCVSSYVFRLLDLSSDYPLRFAEASAWLIGAMVMAPTFAGLSGKNYVTARRGSRE
jgi:hypothetical protein